MTTIATALRTYVLADAAVAALTTRMYPVVLPQDPAMPAITYQYISGASVVSHDGPTGLENPTFQIDCWGSSYSQMDALFQAVRKRLNGAKGTFSTLEVQGIFLVRKRDLYDNDAKLHRRTSDWSIWNEEAV